MWITDQMLKAICNVNWDGRYVNEDWLRGNSEEMFKPDSAGELKALAEKYNMSGMEYAFLREYFKLEPSRREHLFETLDKMFCAIHSEDIIIPTQASYETAAMNLPEKNLENLSDEEIGRLYRQDKKAEREVGEKSEVS